MSSISGIYFIINTGNNRLYIGYNKCIRSRFTTHLSHLRNNRHGNQYLQEDYDFFGEDCFCLGLLEECSVEKLKEREDYWLQTLDFLYNILGPNHSVPEETRRRVSNSLRGRATSRKGTKFSEEWKVNMSKAQTERRQRESLHLHRD